MSIQCKLCGRLFDKQITNRHLKFSHNITTKEYRELYGALVSDSYRKERSQKASGKNNPNFGNKWSDDKKQEVGEKLKGRIPHNKGKKLNSDALEKLRETIKRREIKKKETGWVSPLTGKTISAATKNKISNSLKAYAHANKDKLRERALKSLQTKKDNGYDLAFFKGKKHSADTIARLKVSSKKVGKLRRQHTQAIWVEKIREYGFEILNEVDDHYLKLKCKKCDHVFERTGQAFYDSKYDPNNCNFCPSEKFGSRPELEILNWIASITQTEILYRNKSAIWPKEIDIYLPEFSLGIEYCGLFWHSAKHGVDSKYHQQKWQLASDKNIKLIQIFEDEWLTKKNIVKSMIRSKLNATDRIYARNTTVVVLTPQQANAFYQNNHILGKTRASIHVGLLYQNQLIAAMSFSRAAISRKNSNTWELDRYASKLDTTVVGGMSKLFKHVIDNNPEIIEIITYSDLRYGEGKSYLSLGFELEKITVPNYFYFKTNTARIHRFSLRKQSSDPVDKTEKEIRMEQGYNIIWDAGHARYKWTRAHI